MHAAGHGTNARPPGVGLGLRWSILEEVLDAPSLDGIDFFEISPENYMRRGGYFPAALREVQAKLPVITHGLMMNLGGPNGPSETYLQTLAAFLRELGLSTHSDHLCWSGTDGQILHDLLPLPLDLAHAKKVAAQILRAQEALGVRMAVENISYYASLGPGAGLAEAEFVREVLERADCELLLDVNNVWVNAQNHHFDPYAYLETLDLRRVVELHVAGGERIASMDDLWIDTHGAGISPQVLELAGWVLRRVGPVPVLYERDHKIPSLSDLVSELRPLRACYEQALAKRVQTPEPGPSRFDPESVPEHSMQRMARAILAPSQTGPSGLADLGMDPSRLGVYRKLVHNSIRSVIKTFMPRCAALRGERFIQDIQTWMQERGPRSPWLRDLPFEFFEFIQPQWDQDASVAAYLCDLARHELIEFEVEARQDRSQELAQRDLSLEDRLVFASSATLVHYDFAVHTLSEDPKDLKAPQATPTCLLAYRDKEHDVRYLHLSAMAQGLVERLLDQWPLGQAVLAQAKEDDALDEGLVRDSYLARVLGLLDDLVQRQALLGPACE